MTQETTRSNAYKHARPTSTTDNHSERRARLRTTQTKLTLICLLLHVLQPVRLLRCARLEFFINARLIEDIFGRTRDPKKYAESVYHSSVGNCLFDLRCTERGRHGLKSGCLLKIFIWMLFRRWLMNLVRVAILGHRRSGCRRDALGLVSLTL